jgi:hypothetical protein
MATNCTVYVEGKKLRGKLCRVINPEDLGFIVVELESIGKAVVATQCIKPDDNVKSINYYYYIGNSRDTCPYAMSMFEWYDME